MHSVASTRIYGAYLPLAEALDQVDRQKKDLWRLLGEVVLAESGTQSRQDVQAAIAQLRKAPPTGAIVQRQHWEEAVNALERLAVLHAQAHDLEAAHNSLPVAQKTGLRHDADHGNQAANVSAAPYAAGHLVAVRMAMDAALNEQRKTKALNDRALQKIELTVEQHIKRLRRLSSRAAAVINSAKVSVGSDATESNNVYGDQ